MKKLLQQRWLYHAFTWMTFYSLIWLSYDDSSAPKEETINKFINITPIILFMMIVVYSALHIHDKWFSKRQYLAFFTAFLALPLFWSLVFTWGIQALFAAEWDTGFYQNYVNFLVIASVSLGLRYLKRGTVGQFFLQEAKSQLLEHELNALKSQLNPHFLFNTLNNIYGTNLKDVEKGSEMLLSLSELFRYQLESQKKDVVKLEDEVMFLHDYIELERLRLTEQNEIEFDVSLENETVRVAPLLFLPFVENAIKYGSFPSKKALILISLNQTGNILTLSVQNPIFPNKQVVSTQTGLKNVKRRLEILYPGKHELKIQESSTEYQITLKLQL